MNDNLDMRENPTHTCKKLTFVTNIFVVNTNPQYGHHVVHGLKIEPPVTIL